MTEAERQAAIEESATGPRVMEQDGTHVEEHPLEAQMAADRYLKGGESIDSNSRRGLRFTRTSRPGTA